MRVLSIASFYPGVKSNRGIFIRDEIRGLQTLGVEVRLVAKTSTSPLAYFSFIIHSVFEVLLGKHDLIHAHYVPHSALIPAILKRRPLIVTFHGTDANIFPWQSRLHFMLTQFVVKRCDKIVALSSHIKNTLVDRMNLNPRKIEVIHCSGVDTELFKPMSKRLALKLTKLTAFGGVVLFVAKLRAQKGIPYVLSVAQRMPTVLFVFIGEGQLKTTLRNCMILRETAHENLPIWMNAADILVLPSESEGTPSVILEALACGTPVIASRVGGCPEAVRNGITGFLVPIGDTDALAHRIKYLLANKEERLEMGKRGRKDMLERYEHMKLVKELAQVYAALIQNHKSLALSSTVS
jgi:teichuronic acid biosynthesis glycosyltransferase TuaC